MAEQMVYTQEGYDLMVEELDFLKTVRMPKIKEDIKTARGFGDLSENSEYDEARTEQTKVTYRIAELEELIANATILDESKIAHDVISVGSLVKILKIDTDKEDEYNIVGSNEANPMLHKISDQSPIGSAIIGKRVDDVVNVETPAGILHIKILSVSRASK